MRQETVPDQDQTTPILYRKLQNTERPLALELAWRVFAEYESPDYPPEGTEEFRKTLQNEEYLSGIEYFGAFVKTQLIGIVGIRKEKCHICFFFVDGAFHRRGIGTKLFQQVKSAYPDRVITLNAAPFGLPFYRKLGFTSANREQCVNGIRFTPMIFLPTKEKLAFSPLF